MDDIQSVEDKVGSNIFIYDIDLTDGAMVGELARPSIKKYEKNVQLIRYNSHICYVDDIHGLFKSFRCPALDRYFQKTGNLERHLVRSKKRVKHVYPKNVCQLRETLFDKFDSFDIQYTDDEAISSYFLENGTPITPLLLFLLRLETNMLNKYLFVEYIPVKCFNKFVQSAVNARRKGDENPNSIVAVETMKFVANSSYGYEIMDRSRHTVTKNLND